MTAILVWSRRVKNISTHVMITEESVLTIMVRLVTKRVPELRQVNCDTRVYRLLTTIDQKCRIYSSYADLPTTYHGSFDYFGSKHHYSATSSKDISYYVDKASSAPCNRIGAKTIPSNFADVRFGREIRNWSLAKICRWQCKRFICQ